MKFINTNGMVFIGPGSEWLWTAVSGLVLAFTFIAIYRQLRLQSSSAAIEQLDRYNHEWDSERSLRHQLDILVASGDPGFHGPSGKNGMVLSAPPGLHLLPGIEDLRMILEVVDEGRDDVDRSQVSVLLTGVAPHGDDYVG